MTPADFASCVPLIGFEIGRLRTSATRQITERAHVDLVLAEVWLGYLDGVYVGEPGVPGDERLVVSAAREIHDFLTRPAPHWAPGAWRPCALHRAVDHIIRVRIQAAGGGCEACHEPVPLDLHHLHYRNFGYELPSDVVRLCRDCHLRRHRILGWPADLSWQDGWQWSIHPGEGGQHGGGG